MKNCNNCTHLLPGDRCAHENGCESDYEFWEPKKTNMPTPNKIYISGKITGLDITEAQEKFNRYESSLISEGFEVINPMKISPFRQDKTWNDYMRDCVRALCDCEMIGMMPCWQTSKGAQIEKEIAEKIGIMVCYL